MKELGDLDAAIRSAARTFEGRKLACEAEAAAQRNRAANLDVSGGDPHLLAYQRGLLTQAERQEAAAVIWGVHQGVAESGHLLKMYNCPAPSDASIGALRDLYATAVQYSRVRYMSKHDALEAFAPGATTDPRGASRATVSTSGGSAYPRSEGYPSAQGWQSPERMR
jgi:hypothetical protein